MVSAPSSYHLATWNAWGCAVTNCNDSLIQSCNMVFLCVPPGAALAALHALTPDPDCGERCFVSAVPGLSRQRIESVRGGAGLEYFVVVDIFGDDDRGRLGRGGHFAACGK